MHTVSSMYSHVLFKFVNSNVSGNLNEVVVCSLVIGFSKPGAQWGRASAPGLSHTDKLSYISQPYLVLKRFTLLFGLLVLHTGNT